MQEKMFIFTVQPIFKKFQKMQMEWPKLFNVIKKIKNIFYSLSSLMELSMTCKILSIRQSQDPLYPFQQLQWELVMLIFRQWMFQMQTLNHCIVKNINHKCNPTQFILYHSINQIMIFIYQQKKLLQRFLVSF